MERSLKGKVALVTGASSGIGEATVLELASRGASVVAAARSVEKLEDLARRAAASGVLVVEADVADRGSGEAMGGRTVEKFGRLDVLVNNAGLGLSGRVAELRPEDLRYVFEVNTIGPLNCEPAARPHVGEGGRT